MGLTHVKTEHSYKVEMRGREKKQFDLPFFAPSIMQAVLLAPFEEFCHLGKVGVSKEGRHIYIDRGSPVLAVAHLDSVSDGNYFWINGDYLQCPTIDDRLGAWILLHGLPSVGIYPDVLLTENEERGRSTSMDFKPEEKRWGWMFSFDRKDTDTVFYQYGEGELEKAVAAAGFAVGKGSYSCIRSLDHLGIEGVNVGCGMKEYHSKRAYASLTDIENQIVKFAAFYRQHEQVKFPYTPKPVVPWTPTPYKPSQLFTHYENYLWSDESLWLDERPKDKRKGKKKSLIMGKAERVASRLMDEARAVEAVFEIGLAAFLEGEVDTLDWQDIHNVPDEAMLPDEVLGECSDCGFLYLSTDMKFSHIYQVPICRGCWLNLMERLDLWPTLEEEVKSKKPKLPKLLTPKEGDSHADHPSVD